MTLTWRGIVCVMSMVIMSGCASTTMRTARQLEAGDIVISGGLDEPGFLYVPRVSAQMMYGLGVGDLSVHGGTTFANYNAGLGGRFYLGDHWNAGLQLDVSSPLGGSDTIDLMNVLGVYSGTLQVTTAATRRFGLYGGFHLGGSRLGGYGVTYDDPDIESPVFNVGVLAGFDVLMVDNLGLQFEARFAPLYASASGVGYAHDSGAASLFMGQVGISLYKRWSPAPSINGSVAEDRWNAPENDLSSP